MSDVERILRDVDGLISSVRAKLHDARYAKGPGEQADRIKDLSHAVSVLDCRVEDALTALEEVSDER